MARVNRQGVDYFPLDVDLDNKFKVLEAKHGLQGFAVVLKMMQAIYKEGYWIKFDEDEQMIYASEFKISRETLMEIIQTSLDKNIFSKEIFSNYNVLTSRGIQKQYKEMTKRRKEVEIVCNYTLVSELMSTSCQHHVNKSTQTETETETEKETEIENEIESKDSLLQLSNLWTHCGYGTLNSNTLEKLETDIEMYSWPWVKEAIEIGDMRGKRSYSYVKGILNRWNTDGKEELNEPGRKNPDPVEKPRRKYGRQRTEEELDAIDVNDPNII